MTTDEPIEVAQDGFITESRPRMWQNGHFYCNHLSLLDRRRLFYHSRMAARSRQSEESGEERDVLRVGLGDALREVRKEAESKLTQAELSARAGLPSNAIGDLERGERTIKGEELKSICKVLGIQVNVFMDRVKKAQLRAMGEPDSSDELQAAASGTIPDFFLTVPFAGGRAEDVIRMVDRVIKARRPASPEDAE